MTWRLLPQSAPKHRDPQTQKDDNPYNRTIVDRNPQKGTPILRKSLEGISCKCHVKRQSGELANDPRGFRVQALGFRNLGFRV